MEVHTHTHTARKKWTHYFWEFLMLFLAVFAGFLAENQREHIVEHQLKDSSPIALNELANRLNYWAAVHNVFCNFWNNSKKWHLN
jgi:hypothetical protein